MALSYSAFGLALHASRPIPGLPIEPAPRSPDVRVWLADLPAFAASANEWVTFHVSSERDGETPLLRASRRPGGGCLRLRYADGVEFFVSTDGTDVWASWPETSSLDDAATYLLGPVLGLVLRLRGVVCLHASAIAVGGRAIALLGPASAGKSTTAAAFARMGHPVLTDDVTALTEPDETIWMQPGYPQLRLWPDAVARLFGSADALPRLTPSWDKRAMHLGDTRRQFQPQPLPLAAVYLLDARSSAPAGRIDALTGREALMTLVANAYVSYLQDAAMRRQEFDVLGRVAATVPVRRVVPPDAPAGIMRLCQHILSDFEALACTPLPTTAR